MVRMTLIISWLGKSARCVSRVLPAIMLLAAFIMTLPGNSAHAQLSGSYTIGPTGNYTTIGDFVSALTSNGVNGPVTATVQAGTYNETISIGSITGASSTNTITIDGVDPSTRKIEYNTAGYNTYVIRLNGADYVRIRNLTIEATGTTYGFGVVFTNQADYNEVTGCNIKVSTSSTYDYCIPVVMMSSTSIYSSGNHANNNLIEDNVITGGYIGVRMYGNGSTTNCSGNQVIDNVITEFYYYGVYSYYQAEVEIIGNYIQDRGVTTAYGIYGYYNREGPQIVGNTIRIGYMGIYYYYANQDNSVRGSVSNNMITTTMSGNYNYGIYVPYGYKMDIVYNSVNLMTDYYAYGMYLYNYSTSQYDVRNNSIQYLGTYTCYFIYCSGTTSGYFTNFDYNNYYNPYNYYTFYHSGYYYSLSSLKSSRSPYHANSSTYNPEYETNFDLHTYSQNLNGAATPLTNHTTDIDGDTRSGSSPDIGADEYTLYALDAGAKTITKPASGCGLSAASELAVGIRNYGTSTLNASVNPVSVFVTVTGPSGTQNFSATMSSGSISPGGTSSFTVTTNADFSVPGPYTINAYTTMSGDGNVNNNTMKPFELYVDANIASFPYFEDFEAGNGAWRSVSLGGLDDWEYGDPNYTGSYSVTNANSGQYCWGTKLSSTYNNGAYCALMSPCIDMSTLNAPVLQFYAFIGTEGYYDGAAVEISSNGGQTWTRLYPYYPAYNYTYSYGPLSAPMWAATTYASWQKYVFLLGSYAYQPNVKIRIMFGSDGSVNNYPGVYVDDIAIGDFLEKDLSIADVVYDNATNYWARRDGSDHVVHARVVNLGYEKNPTTVNATYKQGSVPGFQGDGVAQSFSPSWQGSSAWLTFSTQHMPTTQGQINMYARTFYTGDMNAANDWDMTSPIIQAPSVYGYENFNTLTPPNFEKGWSVLNVNSDAKWSVTAGSGVGGSNAMTYPGDANQADDWVFTPGAWLLAGSSYSLDFQYRSRTGSPQVLEVYWGPSPDPNSMTLLAVFNGFTNTSFNPAIAQYNLPPFFNTPNVAQLYYIGFRARSAAGMGALDVDDIRLYDNPYPPPKIAYGIDPVYSSDPLVPIVFTGVYKKTGLLTRTYEVVNATGWYGTPEGDMLWWVNTNVNWINLIISTPDPMTYLVSNPFNPEWPRQRQTFTMEINGNILPPGKHTATIDFDAWLFNSFYSRGIRASNAIFSVPVELTLSDAGGAGSQNSSASYTQTGLHPGGNPWIFADSYGNPFATVWVQGGLIPEMTITSYPGQLPKNLSRYRYVEHYWTIDANGAGWVADISFHYFDSEVLSGQVYDENWLRGMRIAPNTAMWEDPIMGTASQPFELDNYVLVQNINPTNYAGMIALAHDWVIFFKDADGAVPSEYSLEQNYPNPFNPSTEIKFGLPEEQHVQIVVTNSLGKEVARLADKTYSAGYHTVTFNAEGLPSGMYMYTITSGEFVQTRTMILNK